MCTWSAQPVPARQRHPRRASPSRAANRSGRAHQPGQDIATALQSLARQVSELQADNDRLREDYDRLSAEVARIRALMRQAGGAIAQQASQLLAGAGD